MTVPISYPGVYIQEEVSSVHTITGVPTSVAAFVGYLPRGPINTAVHVGSWPEFERTFGALDPSVEMSYQVYLFFANGGSDAEIVRAGYLSAANPQPTKATIVVANDFVLQATSEGSWANSFNTVVKVNPQVQAPANQPAIPQSFNLTIQQLDALGNATPVESYTGLTTTTVQSALASSNYFNFASTTPPTAVPPAGTYGQAPPSDAKSSDASGSGSGTGSSGSGSATGSSGGSSGDGGSAKTPPATSSSASTVGVDGPTDISQLDILGKDTATGGIHALDTVDIFNILCLPKPAPTSADDTAHDYSLDTLTTVLTYCAGKRAMLLVDPPAAFADNASLDFATAAVGFPSNANAAIYFPNLSTTDPTTGLQSKHGPCGAVAGVWATTDAARGVWKAPAGIAATLAGIDGLAANLTDDQNGQLNPLGINCLRSFPLVGPVVWGARTCRGADALADQWKYLPVRRTALFIEESLRRGTQWVVFEPNDETLWAAIRLNLGAFMNSLFRQGAFQGSTPADAYVVKCDAENNPQNDIDRGIVNILVGFAPLKPAEFVIISIQQLAGQLQV